MCYELTFVSIVLNQVRTGQAHRTLFGHTGPVTCLQFDEIHIASGSLDKTLQVRANFPLLGCKLNWVSINRYGTCERAVYLKPSSTITLSQGCSSTHEK